MFSVTRVFLTAVKFAKLNYLVAIGAKRSVTQLASASAAWKSLKPTAVENGALRSRNNVDISAWLPAILVRIAQHLLVKLNCEFTAPVA